MEKQTRFIFAFANYLGRIAFSYEMTVGGYLNAKENHRRYDEWKVSVLMGLFDIVSVHSASVDELEGNSMVAALENDAALPRIPLSLSRPWGDEFLSAWHPTWISPAC